MFYIGLTVDDEPYEIELDPDGIYLKCPQCGEHLYGLVTLFYSHAESEQEKEMLINLCPNCRLNRPSPEEKQIQYAEKSATALQKLTRQPVSGGELLAWANEGGHELILQHLRGKSRGAEK